MATPTVRKLQLGHELRRLREAARLTPADAARALACTTAKISRLESGENAISLGDLKLLLELYEDGPEHRTWMIELSRDNRRRRRWTGHWAAVPEWFRTFVDLERDAEDIRIVASEVIPGLLQTEAYMRALFETGSAIGGPTDVESSIKTRLERQALLDKDDPPMLSIILSESCVRRMVGDRALMAEQLEHVATMAGRRRIQLQLHPFDGETTVVLKRFIMIRVRTLGGDALPFAYCEDPDDARYIDDPRALRIYESLWGALQAAALGPGETRSRLREMAGRLAEGSVDDHG
ncbi:helix-turn-helix domain-containing protein [Pseudonocardia acaciae]|uniref:helix-turn-helix domain-containing protein n=1 Tax=Pseudonocardia acaciae TaxID=551276 RepID=UPI000B2667A0|nr:helix-turn-helix transcriptional regulator [Pseudonocardia acaciae]